MKVLAIKKILPIEQYLQTPDKWKMQLTLAIKCFSFKNVDEECLMHSNSKIMINDKAEEVIKKKFE